MPVFANVFRLGKGGVQPCNPLLRSWRACRHSAQWSLLSMDMVGTQSPPLNISDFRGPCIVLIGCCPTLKSHAIFQKTVFHTMTNKHKQRNGSACALEWDITTNLGQTIFPKPHFFQLPCEFFNFRGTSSQNYPRILGLIA